VCPDENTLAAMIQGFLEPEQLRELEAHLDGCPACLQVVVDTAQMLDSTEFPASGPTPRRKSRNGAGDPDSSSAGEISSGVLGAVRLQCIGRYEILHELGSGAQGVVYAAFDPDLQRQVAIKIVRPDRAREQGRVQREARLLATLSHAHVLAVYEIGPWPGGVYMVTELVRGGTLRAWASTPRPWREIVEVWLGAGRGLAAAHRAGLVHRDVKPDNFLLHEDGRALLTDFGLASATPWREGLRGTPVYLAPELARGSPADARSDQFAFCVGLFEALHGVRPFPGSTLEEMHEHVRHGRTSPRRRGVPARVNAVVERGLRADPQARFRSMEALLQALEGTRQTPWWPAAAGAGALGLLALLGLALGLQERPRQAPRPQPVPAPVISPVGAVPDLVARCDELALQVEPLLVPCGESPTCAGMQLGRALEVAQCYELYAGCEGFHRWLQRAQQLQPDAPILGWRTSSLACPPPDPQERLTHFRRFASVLMLQGLQACRQTGATARELLPTAGTPEQRDQLWAAQLDVVRMLMYSHRLPEQAREEAALGERAFGRRVDWQALSRQ
jgi:hypothetical protein